MIDLTKQYTTADGKEVKLSFTEQGVLHGYYRVPAPDDFPDGVVWIEWRPFMWEIGLGTPAAHPQDIGGGMDLVEVKPSKQVSVTIYVSKDGNCTTRKDIEHSNIFGAFTVNAEVEEGSFDKVYKV